MTTTDTTAGGPSPSGLSPAPAPRAHDGWFARLVHGQTAIDFWGRRWRGYGLSLALIAATIVSLAVSGLNLGIDFEGGVAYDVPAANFTANDAETVLSDHGVDPGSAKIQERGSESGDIIKVQIGDQPEDVRNEIRDALAADAGVQPADVSVSAVSASWGEQITRKAIIALVVFLVLVSIFISIRFEWQMAVAAVTAMLHDVVVSVGIYSILGLEVSPETVIAFLTILGYSLYDTIVVFDRVRENGQRLATTSTGPIDVVNMSTNQMLLRSLNTSFSSILPVLSLLVIGASILGVVTLRQFAIALLVGMVAGAYSSLFIAAPLLATLRARSAPTRRGRRTIDPWAHRTGEDLRQLVVAGSPQPIASTRTRTRSRVAEEGATREGSLEDLGTAPVAPGPAAAAEAEGADATRLLGNAPRPRKKQRR